MSGPELVELASLVAMGAITLGLIAAAIRLLRGPTLPDRVVALELMATLMMGLAAVESILADEPVFVDVAIVLSLVAFLGAIAFARYIERRGRS
jgi:multicomponent Na+:H+ antiporter subunit F